MSNVPKSLLINESDQFTFISMSPEIRNVSIFQCLYHNDKGMQFTLTTWMNIVTDLTFHLSLMTIDNDLSLSHFKMKGILS